MNESSGVVVRLEGDDAWVRPHGAVSACGGCAQRSACGVNSAGDVSSLTLLRLPNSIHANVGDAVVIQAADGMLLRAVWSVYGAPLILALAGAIVGLHVFGSEVGSIAGILSGLASGFALSARGKTSGPAPTGLSMSFKNPSRFK